MNIFRLNKRVSKRLSVVLLILLLFILCLRWTRSNQALLTDEHYLLSQESKYATFDMSPRMKRYEPGYMGKGVHNKPDEKEQEELGYSKHAFNLLASNKISLKRMLPDYRKLE